MMKGIVKRTSFTIQSWSTVLNYGNSISRLGSRRQHYQPQSQALWWASYILDCNCCHIIVSSHRDWSSLVVPVNPFATEEHLTCACAVTIWIKSGRFWWSFRSKMILEAQNCALPSPHKWYGSPRLEVLELFSTIIARPVLLLLLITYSLREL